MNCPKCDADISDSYEPDDWSVGIVGGWYCDACDLGVGEAECIAAAIRSLRLPEEKKNAE